MFEKLFKKVAKFASSGFQDTAFFELTEQTFKNIHEVIDQRAVRPGVVARQEDFRDFEVVGESFYSENLTKLAKGKAGKDAGWFSGFLLCEPSNQFDRNAVAVYLIDTTNSRYEAEQVGYLPKEVAASVNKAIMARLATKGEVVPILGRLFGGEGPGKENYGVSARVFWDFN